MPKKWSYGIRVREWFLAPKNWDQQYEPGDSRECATMFTLDTPDIEKAKQHLIDRGLKDDVQIEILEVCYKVEINEPVTQQPKTDWK